MSFLQTLALDQTFWGTLATVDAALIVAVVIEGRTVREDLDRIELERRKEFEEKWATWNEKFRADQDAGASSPDPPPSLIRPVNTPDQEERTERLAWALLATGALALSLVLALFFLSPLPTTQIITAAGFTLAIGTFLVGLAALVILGSRRIIGRRLTEAIKKK